MIKAVRNFLAALILPLTNTPYGYIITKNTPTGYSAKQVIFLGNTNNNENCPCCCRHKATPRSDEAQRQLQSRLNRIIGQLNGIKKMIEDNRYCGDILIQTAAAESALKSFGYIILQDHMHSCVVEEIKHGNTSVVDKTVELVKKLK